MSDEERFAVAMNALAVAFSKPVNRLLLDVYWKVLRDMGIDAIELAVSRALSTEQFFPAPAKLRALAGEASGAVRATIAWAAVRRAIREVGAYRPVAFDDPRVTLAVEAMGGWPALCASSSEELDKFGEKNFSKYYTALEHSPLRAPAFLPGLHANDLRGTPQTPVKVLTQAESPLLLEATP